MYEYAPKLLKKKEKLLTYGFLGLGVLLFSVSFIPGLPFPWVFELLAVFSFVPMVYIFSLCLSRRYVYTVLAKSEGGVPDFVITEYYGRRQTVVCRISLASIKWIRPWDSDARRKDRKTRGMLQYFSYTGTLFGDAQYAVCAEECGISLLLRICADEELLNALGGLEKE